MFVVAVGGVINIGISKWATGSGCTSSRVAIGDEEEGTGATNGSDGG